MDKPIIEFFDFQTYHGKQKIGSTYIRVHQLLKYWPEARLYRYGSKPDVLIFQKVFVTQDYKFPIHYPGVKILDICDPVHLEGMLLKETIDAMDAVTCSTKPLTTFIKQLTDKPVITIPDRFDLEFMPPRKIHRQPAQTVVWFGYRHNAGTVRPALRLIQDIGLKLLVISDDDPMIWQWLDNREMAQEFRYTRYTYLRYNEDTIYTDLQRADFAVLPQGGRPVDYFKSNNKTVKAILAGLPVAKTSDEVRKFMDAGEREAYMQRKYEQIREEYDVRKSVNQYIQLIESLGHHAS